MQSHNILKSELINTYIKVGNINFRDEHKPTENITTIGPINVLSSRQGVPETLTEPDKLNLTGYINTTWNQE